LFFISLLLPPPATFFQGVVCIYLHLYLLSFFLVLITRPLAVHQTIQYIKENSIFLSALLLLQGFIVSPLPLPTDSLLRQGFIFYDTDPPYYFRVLFLKVMTPSL
jgi:hypothetical protein